jgi:predicted  nucleic acid-binding Zn-ribbon protein
MGELAMKTGWLVAAFALAGLLNSAAEARALDGPMRGHPLPSFSEEREVAALHFARKHVPDLVPVLEKLKSSDHKKYETEICELFQTCEWLTDMRAEDDKRYAIELDIWKTETKSLILVARMAGLKEEEREKHKDELQDYARKLVDMEMQIMRHRVETLEKELGEARDDVTKAEEQRDNLVKERFNRLLDDAKRLGTKK